jgi:hypothetical protein
MASTDPYLLFTRKLQSLDVPYMISGSVAATFYGEPRMTNDVDIVAFLKSEDIPRLESAFPPGEFYCPPAEVIRQEWRRPQRGHFNLIHHASGFKADIYLSGNDPLHTWGIAESRKEKIGEDEICLAPPEYVILRKLQFYREGGSAKHLRDIHRMLLSLEDRYDRASLEHRIAQHGLSAEWASARNFTEP